ncbi:MAG: hypothetical protein V3W18_06755 [candidate division Zixibacteria bacterium]
MHKLLATSTAARPTGSPPQRKLFRISDGVFAGRLAALYMDSASGISLTYADSPYSSWSTPQQVISDSSDSSFSGSMDKTGNVRIVYTDSAGAIKYLKLSIAAGTWNAGSAVTIVNVDSSYNPFIMTDGDGKLWCMFVNHQTSSDSNYYVRAKTSSDDGLNWGSGSLDLGDLLSAGSSDICFVTARQLSSSIYAVYTSGRSDLKYNAYDLGLGTWGGESSIHSGNYIDDDFDFAVSPDKKLGVVFAVSTDSKIYFKEFDGAGWSGLCEIEGSLSKSPRILYADKVSDIFFAKIQGGDYGILRHARKTGDTFSVDDFSAASGLFEKVFVYDDSAATRYEDKSSEAADSVTGDIFHSESSALLDAVDDCLYLGKQERFVCTAILLSVNGAGGQVVWEYFDGSLWKTFIPQSGVYHFDSADSLVYLWTDGESIPSDWQIGTVNGHLAYWVRAWVGTAYTTNPVGSMLIPAPRFADLALAKNHYEG